MEALLFGSLALLLGIKHSFDADHLVAVSNLLRKPRSFFSAIRLGSSWALGHMVTAAVITLLLFFFRASFLPFLLSRFETIAGVMLIALGVWSLRDAVEFHSHSHVHSHARQNHAHWHAHFFSSGPLAAFSSSEHHQMAGIGFLQGLASNDELLVLLTAFLGVAGLWELLAGVSIFSIGVVIGMIVFSALFSISRVQKNGSKYYAALSLVVGLSSIAYGAWSLFVI